AGVGEHSSGPAHEMMNAPEFAKNLRARPEQEMIRVCQQNLGACIFESLGQLGLDRRLSADRHENRSEHLAVESLHAPRPCTGAGRGGFELEWETQVGH